MATRQQRIDWLLANPLKWQGWPPISWIEQRQLKRELVKAMKAEGLLSVSTNWRDVTISNLIQEARRQRREQASGGGE